MQIAIEQKVGDPLQSAIVPEWSVSQGPISNPTNQPTNQLAMRELKYFLRKLAIDLKKTAMHYNVRKNLECDKCEVQG